MSNIITIKDDAQVSVNKGTLSSMQNDILNECMHSLINTMNSLPWYAVIFHSCDEKTDFPIGLINIERFFNPNSSEEERLSAYNSIKYYIQDADWHNKPRAARRRFNKAFSAFYYEIVEEYHLINDAVLMAIISRLYEMLCSKESAL